MRPTVALLATLLAAVPFAACTAPAGTVATADAGVAADSGSADGAVSPADVSTETEYVATAADFGCIKNGIKVGHFYVENRLGHLDAAVAAAKSAEPGLSYPVGTIVRLFPLEAMVKRGGAQFAATGGWEMFQLKLDDAGKPVIGQRGSAEVHNGSGSCAGCHSAAKAYDFVCGTTHGCGAIPASEAGIALLQDADPQCP
jgi:hypothetical protein